MTDAEKSCKGEDLKKEFRSSGWIVPEALISFSRFSGICGCQFKS
jgi:hypothetical protein